MDYIDWGVIAITLVFIPVFIKLEAANEAA